MIHNKKYVVLLHVDISHFHCAISLTFDDDSKIHICFFFLGQRLPPVTVVFHRIGDLDESSNICTKEETGVHTVS